jgi:hypothetical protein
MSMGGSFSKKLFVNKKEAIFTGNNHNLIYSEMLLYIYK